MLMGIIQKVKLLNSKIYVGKCKRQGPNVGVTLSDLHSYMKKTKSNIDIL